MKCLFALLALLLASPAWAADTTLGSTPVGNGCRVWKICDNQATAGVCLHSDGNNAILAAENEYTWSLWTNRSTSKAGWTALHVYDTGFGGGYDGTYRVRMTASTGHTPTTIHKTSWNGLSGDLHAEITGTPTGGGVTAYIKGCPLQ